MAFPVVWCKNPFFYPIGNTPPVCLAQHLAPEEDAKILLLGCGDPRSILFTTQVDLGTRKLDFTCCDLEPAVLARNILLLTMIADGVSWLQAWRIFYHIFLDDDSLNTMLSQCRSLVKSSETSAAWNASGYGKYIRFCTEESIVEIRHQWELYLETPNLSKQAKKELQNSFSSHMKKILKQQAGKADFTVVRASGPLNITSSVEPGTDVFQSFWTNGAMKGTSAPSPDAPHVNPVFAYSLAGLKFNVHHRTNPVASFHLSLALSPIQGAPSSSKITGANFVEAAMNQFSAWCSSFHARVNAADPCIVIRFFSGDCIPFCQTLLRCRTNKATKTGTHARSWGLGRISLTEDYEALPAAGAPLLFNVIDTSNLIDSLGLLNTLLVTAPLLQRTPWSVLHTNTLVGSTPGKGAVPDFTNRIFADVPTMSLLFGLAPSSYLSLFTPECNDEFAAGIMKSGNFYQSISWRYPSSVVPYSVLPYPAYREELPILVCDERRLGGLLFSVYTQMFAEENIMAGFSDPIVATYRTQLIHYNRSSFVEFLSFVKGRTQVDWTKVMKHLIDLVETDTTLILGGTNYQDLICQLYLKELFSVDTLQWKFLKLARSPGDYFDGWQDVPPVVSVTLRVPRSQIRKLEDLDRSEVGIPILFCDTRGAKAQNAHSSIRPIFGDVVYSGQHSDACVIIKEDQAGWKGTSDLVISFDAPSWLFTKRGNIQSVGLCVRSTPHNLNILRSKLGRLDLLVFSASVADKKHVYITRHRPNESQEICRQSDDSVANPSSTNTRQSEDTVSVDFDPSGIKVVSLAIRQDIVDEESAKTFVSGVPVSTKPVADNALLVSFEGYKHLYRYPFPVVGDRTRTRVARKSSYIEVVGPIAREMDSFLGLSLNPFPIARTATSYNLLNILYVNLSVLPSLRLPLISGNAKSLSTHLALTFTDQEQHRQKTSARYEDNGMVVNLKESISTIILKASELGPSQAIFGLSNPTTGVYAMIFVNGLRLDLSSHTIIADACVIPLNEQNGVKVQKTMNRSSRQSTITVSTLDDEVVAWKALLPAFAERCRTWKHNELCEYRKRGIPACGTEEVWDGTTSPLCGCGLGKDLGAFATVADWKAIQSDATRIAISSLFPFSALEKHGTQLEALSSSTRNPTAIDCCAQCGGPGQPKLLVCGRCKKTQYCAQKCQKTHWRIHKPDCVDK